jgi:hypothetical protein
LHTHTSTTAHAHHCRLLNCTHPAVTAQATASGNVGLAFGLVIAAGACTCLGAALVFFTNLANPKWLSGSLGASAGVMM